MMQLETGDGLSRCLYLLFVYLDYRYNDAIGPHHS
jgi:hypothetical protein